MCGVAGILQFDLHQPAGELHRQTAAMTAALRHRGPDDSGVWDSADGRCSLGHRRLSIIDPSPAGRQPMLAADGRAVITFNGEIYNYLELRGEVEAAGRQLATRTDTEVLLEAVRAWGGLAFPRLDGMYAFALYDVESRELVLARDPFGEKPLYYIHDGKRLAFASELHALQQLPFFDPTITEEALAEYLCFQYVGAPRSLYRTVSKLPPGCYMRVRADGGVLIQRYFEFAPGEEPRERERSLDDLSDQLEEILVRSIRRRLISDVPLGAFLSGGVDSSTVCALVRKKLDIPLETFSMGWVGSEESEHDQARKYAEYLGTRHHERRIAPDATDFLLHAADHLDEPNGDSSCLPTFLLSGFARERVTVAVSGDGGDEMFGGYGRYFVSLRRQRRARRRGRPPELGRRYYGELILFFDDEQLRALFGRVPGSLADHLARLRDGIDQEQGRADLLMRMRKSDVDHYLPGAVLPKVDRMSMRHALEVRTPFLSIELARFAERLPSSALFREGQGKILLKHLAARYLPREWLELPKRGFGLPLTQGWGQRELLEVVGSLLDSDSGALASILGRARVGSFLDEQRDPARTHIYRLWAIGVLESYLRKRPALMPRFEEAPALLSLEFPAVHPLAQRLAGEVGESNAEIVLFCREGLPAWWRDLPTPPTVVAPFAARASEGLRFLQADWAAGEGEGLAVLAGHIRERAVAVFTSPHDELRLTPTFCERLAALGFHAVALGISGRLDASLFRLAPFCALARACRRSWKPPGRRVGAWHRPFRAASGHRLRAHWPLGSELAGQAAHPERFAMIEGRSPLLLAQASLEEIRDFGHGRFRVGARRLWVSSSDHSDPRRNGRRYRLVDVHAQGLDPWWTERSESDVQAQHLEELARYLDEEEPARDRERTPRPGDTVALIMSSLYAGGAERQWVYLGRSLVSRGFRVVLFAFDLEQENTHYLPLAQEAGIEVRDLSRSASSTDPPLARDALDARVLSLVAGAPDYLRRDLGRLTFELAALRADYVACQLDRPNVCGGLAGLLAGARRVLLSFRNVNPSNFSYLNLPWLRDYYLVLERSRRIVLSGNSRFGNEDYARWLGIDSSRIHTIHNGFSPEVFAAGQEQVAALRAELGLTPDTRVVCGLFRLSEEKDPDTFLEVARRLVAARDDIVVLQAGSGPQLPALRQRIERLKLGGRVRLLGRRHDVAELLGASQLLLMTSLFEGLSNVLLEAQYLGVPIVATLAGGSAEAIADGQTGLLAPSRDPDAIATKCLELLDDAERRRAMGSAGRRWVEERFAVDTFVASTLAALGSA